MDFYAVLDEVLDLLCQRGRVTYNAQALQHLLTHSFSGKALAVKRVTTNDGSQTPGVDGMVWDTPVQKACAIEELRQRG